MSKPFDATLKELVTKHPVDWLTQLGVPITAEPEIRNVDLSTVTAAVDTLIKVGDRIIHIDIESGPDDNLARRILLYNVLAHHHEELPVHSIVVLLRSKATGRDLQDVVEYAPRADRGGLRFRFEIVRAWELDAEEVLKAGVGFLPLAVLASPPSGQTRLQALPRLAERIAERAKREAESEAGIILTASYLLSTMHVDSRVAESIFARVFTMDDLPGVTFLEERGALKVMREVLLNQGRIKFGDPSEKQTNKLNAIEDIDRLKRLATKVVTANSWDALLRVK